MNIIDIFYCMGTPCFILYVTGVIELFSFKKIEDDISTSKRIDLINEGSEIATTLGKQATNEFIVDNLKKINPFSVFLVIFNTIWMIIGIIVTEQKISFILLLILSIFSVQITTAITKNKKKQVYIDNLIYAICFLLVFSILYLHFFNTIK